MKKLHGTLGSLRELVNSETLAEAMAHPQFDEAYAALLEDVVHLPFTYELEPQVKLAYVLTKYEFYVDDATGLLCCTDAAGWTSDYVWDEAWVSAD